jgi:flagella basal body P-ring formation protein FlgA
MTATMTKVLLSVLMISAWHSCYAANYEKADRINEIVKNFLTQSIQTASDDSLEVTVNQANMAINVPVCNKDIIPSYPADANKEQVTSVKLSCNGSSAWNIIVPVDVRILSKVLVARHTMAAKETISDDDLDYALYDKNKLYNGFFTKKEDVAGTQTAYIVTAGTVLNKKNIQLPVLVSRNQAITIVAQANSIIVSMQGIARTDGAMNSMIKVYNPSSKKTLDAIVVGPNKAQVVS